MLFAKKKCSQCAIRLPLEWVSIWTQILAVTPERGGGESGNGAVEVVGMLILAPFRPSLASIVILIDEIGHRLCENFRVAYRFCGRGSECEKRARDKRETMVNQWLSACGTVTALEGVSPLGGWKT
jgi:hypothetical protein